MADETLQDNDAELRKNLLRRVAVAGVVVVGLLGGLAVFDALNKPAPVKAPAPVATAPEAAAPTGEKPAEKPTEPVAEAPAPESKEQEVAKPEVPAEPETSSAPTGTLPAAKPERPLTVPARAKPASIRPGAPVAAVAKPEPAKELAKAAEPAPAPAKPLAKAAQAVRQFFVQMGVFSNVTNAEELRAKLELNGIPSQIEARVQVGPFANRQEAEAAREKLHALGLDGGLLISHK
jgi:DedD protein